jgi:hypothetical protein
LFVLTGILLLNAVMNSIHNEGMHPIWKSSILPLLYTTPRTELITVRERFDRDGEGRGEYKDSA